ncbi:MAG TPA: Gfo/Idh/MocA family oxidoreductase, partial [Thermomicrobiaceae bacterium]|nr:Gfo/Idh/MocA family oxidoreductase [Thermomicrobiaceae bacterium]
FLHREQVVAAAQAGKHIHCEKPMASSVAECDAMIAAARAAGVKLMVGHSRRFTRRYQLIREAIARGEIGEVRLVRENERRAYARTPRPGSVGHWNPEGDRPWLAKSGYTLGAAMTNAVHETDLARWFVGQDAASVYAAERINDPESEVPDFISYTVTFRNGAVGAAEIVNTLPVGYPYYHMMEVFGTAGMIRATDPPMSTLEVWTTGQMAHPLNVRTFLSVPDAYAGELAAFAKAVREDTPVSLDPWNARQALAISVAAVESSRTGRPVSLPEEPASAAD